MLPARRDVTFWFKPFDLGPLPFSPQPLDGAVLIKDVRTGKKVEERIEVNIVGAKEQRLENYLVPQTR